MKLSHVTFANDLHQASFASFLQADLPPEAREDSGLHAALRERLTISNDDGTMAFSFREYHLYPPAHSPNECRLCGLTYSAMVRVVVQLLFWEPDPDSGSLQITNIYEQELYLAALPLMTEHGTFLIEGEECVVCHQLRPRPGVWFLPDGLGEDRFAAWLIPRRGTWLKLFFGAGDILYASIDGRKRFPASLLLEALCCVEDELLEALPCLQKTLQRHPFATPMTAADKLFQHHHTQTPQAHYLAGLRRRYRSDEETIQQAYQRVYADGESAGDRWVVDHYVHSLFAAPLGYDMSLAGRRQLDERLGLASPAQDPDEERWDTSRSGSLERKDILATIGYLDSLRRGQKGFFCDHPDDLANQRLWSVGELLMEVFHEGLALMSQTTERRLNKADEYCMPHDLLSPRPLQSRIDGFFADRSQVQPLESLNPLAEFEHRRRVLIPELKGPKKKPDPRQLRDFHPSHNWRLSTWKGCITAPADGEQASTTPSFSLAGSACVVPEGVLESLVGEERSGREEEALSLSPAAGLVPFWGELQSEQILKGAQLQRRAIPLISPEQPLVSTGLEVAPVVCTQATVTSRHHGVVLWVNEHRVIIAQTPSRSKEPRKRRTEPPGPPQIELYPLQENRRPARRFYVAQRPIVKVGDEVKRVDVLADGVATKDGSLALGRNVMVVFVPPEHPAASRGIVASRRLCDEHVFTSQRLDAPGDTEIKDVDTMLRELLRDQELMLQCFVDQASQYLKPFCVGTFLALNFHTQQADKPVVLRKDTMLELAAFEWISPKDWHSLIGALALDMDVADRLLRYCYDVADTLYTLESLHQTQYQRLLELRADALGTRPITQEPLRVGDLLGTRLGDIGRVAEVRRAEDMFTLADGMPVDLILPVVPEPARQMRRKHEAALGLAASKAGSYIKLTAGHWTEAELLARHQELLTATDVALDAAASLLDPKTGEVWDDGVAAGVVYVMKLSEEEPDC